MRMRVPLDERSYDGDRGLQDQLPSSEPSTNSNPTGDRENRLRDADEKVEKEKIVKIVMTETVVEVANRKKES